MEALRAVLDTNVALASRRTGNPGSPNVEILSRWQAGEFELLYSDDIIIEYAEKFIALGIGDDDIRRFLRIFRNLGRRIEIVHFHLRHYPADPDDIAFLLCALNGTATHLVSYDKDLSTLAHFYAAALKICEPLQFLRDLRAYSSSVSDPANRSP